MFKNMNIQKKILSINGSVFFIVFLAVILIVYFNVRSTLKDNINEEIEKVNTNMLKLVETSVEQTIKNYLIAVTNTNLETVKEYYQKFKNGELSEKEAKQKISKLLLRQKIGQTGYNFVMTQSNDIMRIHPQDKLIGKKTPLKDEILNSREGYFSYQYEGKDKVLYMVYFPEWDWNVGTTAYKSDFTQLVNTSDFRDEILSVKLGKSGYTYVMDSKGTAIIHPEVEGENFYDARDNDGNYYIREICNTKKGKITYPWKNKKTDNVEHKAVYYSYFPMMDWIVASGAYLEEAYAPLNALLKTLGILLFVSLGVLGGTLYFNSRSINKDIQKVINQFKDLTKSIVNGQLDVRGDPEEVGVDFKEVITNANQLVNAFIEPINIMAEYIDRISEGNIPDKINDDYKGDFKEVKNNLNKIIDMVNDLLDSTDKLGIDISEGKLDRRGDSDRFRGRWSTLVTRINDIIDGFVGPFNMSAEYVDRISDGDIPDEITEDYKGDFKEIKNNMNKLIVNIKDVIDSTDELGDDISEGKLDRRGDSSKFQGRWATLVRRINEIIDGFVAPFNMSAEYVDRISDGDIPDEITEDYKGDFKEIKNNMNKLIRNVNKVLDSADQLGDDMDEGKLDSRGNPDEFQGRWATLIKRTNTIIDNIVKPMQEAAEVMSKIADKEMTARITGNYEGQLEEFKIDINTAAENLEQAMLQVKDAVAQVSSASDQVASGSQQLAEGSNEQASSLEEVSSTLEEMSSMVQQTSDNSNQANKLSQQASNAAQQGSESMEDMKQAIHDIKESSDQTSKIVKTIDDIAFQTNLLALNAAVEAARAGEAGQGFAVVAEEVRNLAQRSAEAAKNTSEMIQDSIENAENGVTITEQMAEKLDNILKGVNQVNELAEEIDAATKEQAEGIEQVNGAVAQMNEVTQENASNSEESASAAEELNSQAEELSGMIQTFKLSNNGYSDNNKSNPGNGKTHINYKKISGNNGSNGNGSNGNGIKGNGSNGNLKSTDKNSSKEITPEDVIPLDEDEMGNF